MRVGFNGTPVRAFTPLWTGRSPNRPEDLIEYSSSLKLQLFDFSDETLGLSERDLNDIETLGFTDKQASHFRHLAQLAKVGGVSLSLTSSSHLILTAPDPGTRAKALRCLKGLWAVAKTLRCALLAVFPGYSHGSPERSLRRLIEALADLDMQSDSCPSLGVEVSGHGIGTLKNVERLCAELPLVPVVSLVHCIPCSARNEFASRFAGLLEFAANYTRGGPVWVRYGAQRRRVPVGVSEGWPDFRMVTGEIRRFEELGKGEVCVLLDSPRREWDAILMSTYYRLLMTDSAKAAGLSADEIVKAGTPRVVDIGSHVLLRDLTRRHQLRYQIVEPGSADPFSDRISYESPIGRSLLGKESGSIVEIAAPGGSYVYEVVDII